MIVEDEMMISEDIKITLTKLNYNIVGTCTSGEDAVSMAIVKKPELIIMDILLDGELTGIEAAKKITAKSDIPVIFLTAFTDNQTMKTAIEINAYSFLTKPFNEAELKAAIQISFIKHDVSQKIKISNSKFESLFFGNPEPIVYLDQKYRIVEVNSSFQKTFGYSVSETKHKLIFDLIVPPSKTSEAKELSHITDLKDFQTERQTKDGKIIPVLISSSHIIIDGKLTGTIVTYKDISDLKKVENEKEKLIAELQKALNEVKNLSGLIPICSHCKKVRDDNGYWEQVEDYIARHTDVDFSHGICPDCMRQYYPEMYEKMKKKEKEEREK